MTLIITTYCLSGTDTLHAEVLNGQSSYLAVLSAVLQGKNMQGHNPLTSINS